MRSDTVASSTIPRDLAGRRLELPPAREKPIVVIGGSALRHERFALRLGEAFGDRVAGWFQVQPASPRTTGERPLERVKRRLLGPGGRGDVARYRREYGLARTVLRALAARRRAWSACRTGWFLFRHRRAIAAAERRILGDEVRRLRAVVSLTPRAVLDPNAPACIEEIERLRPYFILTLGGPLYGQRFIACARGLAVNQHAGWAPALRGSSTTEWALYHRDLSRVGATVHLLASGADAGPILRRGWACLTGTESAGSCFVRVVALGTELMIDAVREASEREAVTVYDQPLGQGRTCLTAECTDHVLGRVHRDLARGWIRDELARLATF